HRKERIAKPRHHREHKARRLNVDRATLRYEHARPAHRQKGADIPHPRRLLAGYHERQKPCHGGAYPDAYDRRQPHPSACGGGKKGGYARWGQYDQFLAKQLAHFLGRLRSASEGDGNLLDHSLVLYGSATSTTHNARNYPLVLAGGGRLGLKHGAFHKFTEHTPCANLLVTMLHRMEVPVKRFADSTGELSEIL
ncbi:MAG: hypothetical protein N2C14_24470, partial [Planctomycetales bacterium]